jgi:hypothetical protein
MSDYEDDGLPDYITIEFGENLMFRKNISPPASGPNVEISKKLAEA